jgi:hypothetical protein
MVTKVNKELAKRLNEAKDLDTFERFYNEALESSPKNLWLFAKLLEKELSKIELAIFSISAKQLVRKSNRIIETTEDELNEVVLIRNKIIAYIRLFMNYNHETEEFNYNNFRMLISDKMKRIKSLLYDNETFAEDDIDGRQVAEDVYYNLTKDLDVLNKKLKSIDQKEIEFEKSNWKER